MPASRNAWTAPKNAGYLPSGALSAIACIRIFLGYGGPAFATP
jgi:hypothetical protein